MLMLIDVGNTNIVFGIHDKTDIRDSWRISTNSDRSVDELGMLILQFLNVKGITPDDLSDIIISSVVPPIMFTLERALEKYVGKMPIVITNDMKLGLQIKYDNPSEVGADRIVNAIAVRKIYGTPAIIIDFGTATTFCAIDRYGGYLGGAILPGIKISLDALFNKAAKLPRIEITEPGKVIGTNTVASMQAGIYYGYAGSVAYMVKKMKKEMGDPRIKVIATGGLASLIEKEAACIDVIDRNLTLKGLKVIYDILKGTSNEGKS